MTWPWHHRDHTFVFAHNDQDHNWCLRSLNMTDRSFGYYLVRTQGWWWLHFEHRLFGCTVPSHTPKVDKFLQCTGYKAPIQEETNISSRLIMKLICCWSIRGEVLPSTVDVKPAIYLLVPSLWWYAILNSPKKFNTPANQSHRNISVTSAVPPDKEKQRNQIGQRAFSWRKSQSEKSQSWEKNIPGFALQKVQQVEKDIDNKHTSMFEILFPMAHPWFR